MAVNTRAKAIRILIVICRVSGATLNSFTYIGLIAHTTMPIRIPVPTVSFTKLIASEYALSLLSAPRLFPTIIPAALETPHSAPIAIPWIGYISVIAAQASVPRCP